ncbi:MAG: ABC transporter ATP-binding protein [Treponema sp.]|jgi:ABC-type nitrate/sulfonate/bicarbonate transport system ATPase subunit|nr:ABC transporter ATP-binding protein [Treponema sp.]
MNNVSPAVTREPAPVLFACRGITKRYEGEAVVKDISLELPAGRVISLLGPSGTGKTTLFNVLAGVDIPDDGRVLLSGRNITGISGQVSYMMQKDLLLEYRTVLDNVILPLLIRGRITKKEAREQGASFFPRFGLSGCEKKYPRQLSGGMRQRAALLRTCMLSNPVILLDEPFSALDALTRRSMHEWFQEIAAEMNFAALFITHDIEEAVMLSDRVYILTAAGERQPGRISGCFDITAPRPRNESFSVSKEFILLKKKILAAIHRTAGPAPRTISP